MASLLERKKLIADAINKTTNELCDKACDSDDDTGYCASPCHSVCPDYCRYPSPLPEPPITSHHKNSALLIAMFSLLAATVLVICLYVAYVKYRKSRRRRRQREARVIQPDEDLHFDEDQGPVIDHPIWYINTVGLQPSVINSIMVFKYKKGDGLVEGTECSVCLNEFQEDETLRLLPKCSHAFHIPCIDTWLRSHTNCPMCRAPIVANTVRAQTVQQEYGNQSQEGEEGIGEENSLESGDGNRDMESGVEELRLGIEEDDEELEVEDRRKTTEVDDNEIQPLRRSISLDSLAACKISLAVSNVFPAVSGKNSDTVMEKFKGKKSAVNPKRVGSSSAGRSLQAGPGLMRRSLSLSGQILSSMYGRSQNSVLPL